MSEREGGREAAGCDFSVSEVLFGPGDITRLAVGKIKASQQLC